MINVRRGGLVFVFLGGILFVCLGMLLRGVAPASTVDFRIVYYPARTLLEHGDPYKEPDVLRVYSKEGEHSKENPQVQQVASRYIFLPTSFVVTAPFALLPWKLAQALWLTLTIGIVILSSVITWDLAADYAPVLSGFLVFVVLANCQGLIVFGNPAGIVIGLTVISVWCFLQDRLVAIGIACLVVSLLLKPQDTGLIWCYFILAGGVNRKRALYTLAVTVVCGALSLVWVTRLSPDWPREWSRNLSDYALRGAINDPGPTSVGSHGPGVMLINAQSLFAAFVDNPHFYNTLAYAVSIPPILIWAYFAHRHRSEKSAAWFALASIAALSLLPIYHRQYDAKILLLTVPACAILLRSGGRSRWLAVIVTTVGLIATGDLPWATFLALTGNLVAVSSGRGERILMILAASHIPIVLFVVGIFYLLYLVLCSNAKKFRSEQED